MCRCLGWVRGGPVLAVFFVEAYRAFHGISIAVGQRVERLLGENLGAVHQRLGPFLRLPAVDVRGLILVVQMNQNSTHGFETATSIPP